MTTRTRRRGWWRPLLSAAIVAAVASTAAYAFAAGNTIASGGMVGTGSASVLHWTESGITYTLNASSPQNIDSVSFTLTPSTPVPSTVEAQLRGTWYSCSVSGGTWTCPTTSPQLTVDPTGFTLVVVEGQ